MKNAPDLLAALACGVLLLSACANQSREHLADEPLDEPTGTAPNCSLLADEPGCGAESPFDHADEEL